MTPPDAAAVIAGGRPFSLVVAGGGTQAIAALQSTPGCSRVMLEASVPYGAAALDRFIGQVVVPRSGPLAAKAMAWAAWRRTVFSGGAGAVGVSCTAALATDRPRRGADRAHFGWCDGLVCRSWALDLGGIPGRQEQERAVSAFLLGLLRDPDAPGLPGEDRPGEHGRLAEVISGARAWARLEADGQARANPAPELVVSGSFNPLHAGHIGLARAAERLTGRRAAYEITVANADKPPMPAAELLRRLRQFHGVGPVVVTRLGTFAAKAEALPGAIFVVGHDTAIRVLEERFYPPGTGGLAGALAHLRERGCSFLVAGRATEDGVFHPFREEEVPESAKGLFRAIPEPEFRLDISSSEIRARLGAV
ncbi:MAG: hypothetical protein ACKO26_01765 [Planctomycetota bacterium]